MKEKIRLGIIGLGRRGSSMLKRVFSEMSDVEVTAICDRDPVKLEKNMNMLREKNYPLPRACTDADEVIGDPRIDAVVIMTGWDTHVSLSAASLRAGKYTAVEVGCAYTLDECFDLLNAYESTRAPLMMLENCCYGRREMMALRMAREGLFGEIVHCSGGYMHYLNDTELFLPGADGKPDTEHYRLYDYAARCAEQYPTHEFGPISKILGINRGNRMMTLSSFASKAAGLTQYMKDHTDGTHPLDGVRFRQGDVVNTVITCAGGETVLLTLDTTLPRPFYSRGFTVRGTKGMCQESAKKVCTFFLDGMEENVMGNEEEFFEKYDHPLHREYAGLGPRGGHGGMDWLVGRAFVEAVKGGTQTPIDVYDTLAWMCIGPLSEMSIARGGAPVDVPDFTRGKWMRREPPVPGKYCLDAVVDAPATPIFPD